MTATLSRREAHDVPAVEAAPGQRSWSPDLPWWGALALGLPMAAVFCLLVLYPAVELVIASFRNGWDDYVALFTGPGLRALRVTLGVSGSVALISVLIGTVIAWSLRTTRSRLLAVALWIGVMGPVSMSVVVKNFAFYTLLGKYGALNWASDALGLGRHEILFTNVAVTIGMVYSMFPYAVLPLYLTFRSIPDHMLDAATSLGASRLTAIRTVVWPLSLPGYFTTVLLVFVLSIGFFVSPVVLGGPDSAFLSSLIQRDIQQDYDQAAAAAKGVFLIVTALALVGLAYLVVGRERFEKALG